MSHALFALGLGTGTRSATGAWLEVLVPQPVLNPSPAVAAIIHGGGGNAENRRSRIDLWFPVASHNNGYVRRMALPCELRCGRTHAMRDSYARRTSETRTLNRTAQDFGIITA